MKERPILFSAPMVRAVDAGRKTQTRRIASIADLSIKPHSDDMVTWSVSFTKPIKGVLGSYSGGKFSEAQAQRIIASQFCPYGSVGDRLWVREAWRASSAHDDLPPRDIPSGDRVEYLADGVGYLTGRYRHARFMPRWASRIMLEITDVRVQRLQDIAEADAIAEGCKVCSKSGTHAGYVFEGTKYDRAELCHSHATTAFEIFWGEFIDAASWEANSWVWAISFKRIAL